MIFFKSLHDFLLDEVTEAFIIIIIILRQVKNIIFDWLEFIVSFGSLFVLKT